MITEIIQIAQTHKAAFGVACVWLTREMPLIWAKLVAIYPYCAANGGVFGIGKSFFTGKPTVSAAPAQPTKSNIG